MVFHFIRKCFKCSHCNGLLVISNYCSMDGVLHCKTHFEQLFKETGSYSKKFSSGGEKKYTQAKTPSKASSMFSGTQDKCAVCKKTAYPLEKVTVEGEIYHKSCFRCARGGCFLTPSSYAALDGVLYCKIHFAQLFKNKDSYNHINTPKKTADSSAEGTEATQEAQAEPKAAVAEEQ